jgi:peptidyl-prolyl cis-trans isomerase C
MKFRFFPLCLLVMVLLPMAGCGVKPSDEVLATVGSQTITVADYARAHRMLPARSRPDVSDPEKRQALLQDLINKALLEQEAIRRQIELTPEQARRVERFARSELNAAFIRRHVDEKIDVPEEQIKAAWDRLDRQIKARHILTQSEAEAREVLADLAKGTSFAEVAQRRSLDWKTGQAGGTLGWLSAGKMVEPFDAALFRLSAGQTSEPVRSRFGWHIIRVDSVRSVARQPYEDLRQSIKISIMQERSLDLQRQLIAEVIDGAGPQNQSEGMDLINRKFYVEIPAEQVNDPYAKLNQERQMPSFTPEELATPIVKFTTKPDFTLKEFVELLGWMAPGVWPRGGGVEEIEEVLRQMMREKLYREQALAEGIDREPDYVASVKRKEMEIRVNQIYYRGIVANLKLTDADLRSYFEQNRDGYRVAERCQLARIQTADSALAARAAGLWRSGRPFDQLDALVRKSDPRAIVTPRTMETPRGYEPPVDTLVYAHRAGDIVGPVRVPRFVTEQEDRPAGWVVAQVLDIQPMRLMTYDEAAPYVADQAKAAAADRELKKVLEDAGKKFPVRIRQKALDKITPDMVKDPRRAWN